MQRFELTGNIPSKKNSKVFVRKGLILPSKAYRKWHKGALEQLEGQLEPVEGSVEKIVLHLYDKLNKDGSKPRRRFDLSNKVESIMDLLVDAGILEDDNYSIVPDLLVCFKGFRDERGCVGVIY